MIFLRVFAYICLICLAAVPACLGEAFIREKAKEIEPEKSNEEEEGEQK